MALASGIGGRPLFAASPAGAFLAKGLPAGLDRSAVLEALPGKQPLIKLSYRPPNYESPLEYFTTPITPNERFYVRYHLSEIPEVDIGTYRIAIGGEGANDRVEITFEELRKFPAYEVVAVDQCSGNRRGLSKPHVPGVQWGYGAMGYARWKGARLKDLLDKAGLKKEAIEIAFNGADEPPFDKTPDFIKSLPVWKAIDESTLEGDLGRYAFRPWSFDLTVARGKTTITVNAINTIGQTQTAALVFNPAGYHNNVMQSVTLGAG